MTCFQVMLPEADIERRHNPSQQHQQSKHPARSRMSAASITILCVDDEEIPRTLRALVLRKQGYQVITAASAAEALQALVGTVDLVLSDQMMSAMSGTELTK